MWALPMGLNPHPTPRWFVSSNWLGLRHQNVSHYLAHILHPQHTYVCVRMNSSLVPAQPAQPLRAANWIKKNVYRHYHLSYLHQFLRYACCFKKILILYKMTIKNAIWGEGGKELSVYISISDSAQRLFWIFESFKLLYSFFKSSSVFLCVTNALWLCYYILYFSI